MYTTHSHRNSTAARQTPQANGGPLRTNNARLPSTEILDQMVEHILELDEAGAILLAENLDSDAIQDLEKYRVGGDTEDASDGDVSLLQMASAYSVSSELISLIALKCPNLLLVRREFPCEGQTPLHTLVSKENFRAVASVFAQQAPEMKERLLKLSTNTAIPSPINATVMLGGLPLSVAALTFNLDLVDLLLHHGAELIHTNDRGDTVFHSLVRFSTLYPEKEAQVEEVMGELHRRLKERHEPRSVWLAENHYGLTALKLAARGSQPLLFNFILTLKGVYCDLDEHDGLFDSLLYDITDIDPIAIKHLEDERKTTVMARYNKVHVAVEGIPKAHQKSTKRGAKNNHRRNLGRSSVIGGPGTLGVGRGVGGVEDENEVDVSVMEIIYQMEKAQDAFKILDNHVVSRVIQDKWKRYSWLFVLWTVAHLLTMLWITGYAVCKSRVTTDHDKAQRSYFAFVAAGTSTGTATTAATTTTTTTATAATVPVTTSKERALPLQLEENVGYSERQFVYATASLTGIWAVCLVLYEFARLFKTKSLRGYVSSLLYHHNGFYRLQLIVFGVCLLVDDVLFALWYRGFLEANNYCLIVALLVGWWFSTFFLRPWKKFSFFTVMLQEVLVGDMFRFSIIFIPELLAFSIAMHITFLPTEGPLPEEFATMGTTLMTMFKLMLGLSDVSVLYEAPESWLAIVLFVLYVLLTYTLMMNALIALMSNTCSIVSHNRENQWKLQRLSIVLFLQESLWMCMCLHSTGQPRRIRVEDIDKKQTTAKTRFVLKISSVRSGDGSVVVKGAAAKRLAAEGDRTLHDDYEEEEDPPTAAATDMYDLLAALNFQRRQALATQEEERRAPLPTGARGELTHAEGGIDTAVRFHVRQHLSSTYVDIRHKLKKLSRNPFSGEEERRQSCASEPKPPQAPSEANSAQQVPAANQDVVDGEVVSNTEQRIPEQRTPPSSPDIPKPAKGERVILFPAIPGLQLDTLGVRPPVGQRPMSADKRKKLRNRPSIAERREHFQQKRREDSLAKRRAASDQASNRTGSATSLMGHGIFEAHHSRIHMHTKFHE